MGSNKKDLEIIYNLQWKSGNGTAHSDKSNIVGMYDIPATTLNWETFKSYLLKNSGAMVEDVKVSYVSSDDKEFPIESQLDFQIALYSFRQRARNNDVITLKLDRVSDIKISRIKRQHQHIEEGRAATIAPTVDEIPDWFKNFMKEYKKEIVDEVTASVVNAVSSVKIQALGRKLKEASTKRLRKSGENNDKEVRKTLKLERKIEELEEKTNKIKEKKLALTRSVDNRNRPIGVPISDAEVLMDATPTGPAEVTVPHMSGGEIYRQEWIVTNTGSVTWTSETELRYAWGSEALKPIQTTVACPLLKPGEKGSVIVFLEVPSVAGEYECYWHFCHNGRRFGHWLGCHITVDASPIKMLSVHRFDPIDKSIIVEPPTAVSWSSQSEKLPARTEDQTASIASISAVLDDLALVCSDSDNQSDVSVAESSSSVRTAPRDDFVMVPIETETEPEETVKPVESINKSGYAYVNLDGKKHAVPKMFLRNDYLETAEEALPPEDENPDNKRLFVFPLNCPGFEVVYPPSSMSESLIASAGLTASANDIASENNGQTCLETEVNFEHNPFGNSTIVAENATNEQATSLPVNNHTFTTAPSMFLNDALPILRGPTMPVPPPPPITIPIPPPRTIPAPLPPTFTYNVPSNPTPPWLYPAPISSSQFGPYGTTPNANYRYQYVHNDPFMTPYMYSNAEGFCPQPLQQPIPNFEGDECPMSPNNSPVQTLHVIPETLVSGAVNVASSAINTARSVLNMFTSAPIPAAQPMPAPSQATAPPSHETARVDPMSPREIALDTLQEMGFWDRSLNQVLLERFHDDIGQVVTELVK